MSWSTNINNEITRCKVIRYNLVLLYSDASLAGCANLIYRTAKDILTLYSLEYALTNAEVCGLTETQIDAIVYKIREFLAMLAYNSSVDYFDATNVSVKCPTTFNTPYTTASESEDSSDDEDGSTTSNSKWRYQDLDDLITEDGQTTITPLDFYVGDIDNIATIHLTVQGDDPKYSTTSEGYHIIGNTLYWHSYYDLKVGMQARIEWKN